ncbi:class I SAM-dependent methyltransferase [Viridibacterium curvum]|uniref:Class I SAM-dependent methyltransferase n=2 Tax=Viridibacterium curvum TaxID=1101404 RepID=A0ABP9QSQ6_9RHOO
MHMSTAIHPFVEESRFGNWFLNTGIWKVHVIRRALDLLQPLLPDPSQRFARILDVGCGFGHSFAELSARFAPDEIVALDADPAMSARAGAAAAKCASKVTLHAANAAQIDLPDASFDMLLCHQTFHHIVEQEAAMAEFFRVLKPGGVLLFAESTKRYIHSWMIRTFFRHPMEVQKTSEEYVAMIRAAGFDLPDARINLPYLWWSREDLGFFETVRLVTPPPPGQREETLVNAVALKPL